MEHKETAAEFEARQIAEQKELEVRCGALITPMRELVKAEAEEKATRAALALALRAATGTPEDVAAVCLLVDRCRWTAGLLDAKRKAWAGAAREAGLEDNVWRGPRSMREAARYMREVVGYGSSALAADATEATKTA